MYILFFHLVHILYSNTILRMPPHRPLTTFTENAAIHFHPITAHTEDAATPPTHHLHRVCRHTFSTQSPHTPRMPPHRPLTTYTENAATLVGGGGCAVAEFGEFLWILLNSNGFG